MKNNTHIEKIEFEPSEKLKAKMKWFPEVNWNMVCEKAIEDYVKRRGVFEFMNTTGIGISSPEQLLTELMETIRGFDKVRVEHHKIHTGVRSLKKQTVIAAIFPQKRYHRLLIYLKAKGPKRRQIEGLVGGLSTINPRNSWSKSMDGYFFVYNSAEIESVVDAIMLSNE